MIIDTHIHLFDPKYREDLEEIIRKAQENGVVKMVVVGFDEESSRAAIELSRRFDFLYAAVGLHPEEVMNNQDGELNWLKDMAPDPKVVAIGEIGLDYYWDKTYQREQMDYFQKQLAIAANFNLPVLVHSREASADTFETLKKHLVPGVLHCYSGSLEMAKEYVKLGYYLGIGGVVTFKNSKEIKRVVTDIPLEHLLSETDGPYLAPSPHRGKLNKPEYLPLVIAAISELKGIDPKIVEKLLFENAMNLFNI